MLFEATFLIGQVAQDNSLLRKETVDGGSICRFAEMHLEMPAKMELKMVHDICDQIENELQKRIRQIEVNIHVEPTE